jgi:hypothetical protein
MAFLLYKKYKKMWILKLTLILKIILIRLLMTIQKEEEYYKVNIFIFMINLLLI